MCNKFIYLTFLWQVFGKADHLMAFSAATIASGIHERTSLYLLNISRTQMSSIYKVGEDARKSQVISQVVVPFSYKG